MNKISIIVIACLSLLTQACTGGGSSSKFMKNPLDVLITEMSEVPNFSIILFDMDFEDNLFDDVYRQKYQIIIPKEDGEIDVKETDWKEVPEVYFQSQINNMGMEIASKVDGKLEKKVSPAGYSQFVGNPQYGQWSNSGGSSFWEFYGRYAMMSSLFNMMSPVPRTYHDDYSRNYRNTDRTYYGTGNASYGTASTMKNRTSSRWGKSQSTFKTSVQNKVRRSTAASSRAKRSSSSTYRSRGGGFGK